MCNKRKHWSCKKKRFIQIYTKLEKLTFWLVSYRKQISKAKFFFCKTKLGSKNKECLCLGVGMCVCVGELTDFLGLREWEYLIREVFSSDQRVLCSWPKGTIWLNLAWGPEDCRGGICLGQVIAAMPWVQSNNITEMGQDLAWITWLRQETRLLGWRRGNLSLYSFEFTSQDLSYCS